MTIAEFRGQYRWLSNFWYCKGIWVPARAPIATGMITAVEPVALPTVEHAYVVLKAGFWEDFAKATGVTLEYYREMKPGQAKRLGRKLVITDLQHWESVKVRCMRRLLEDKFSDANPDLVGKLLATSDRLIIEGNTWHDQFWGDCTCPKHRDVPGRNMLGELIMRRRGQLK